MPLQTDKEYAETLTGRASFDYEDSEVNTFSIPTSVSNDLPNSIDWRTKGVVTSVKDQVSC